VNRLPWIPVISLLLAGCASPPAPAFSLTADRAAIEARARGEPLLVLSVVGDLDRRL
jgi:uncharacterized lipoprotein YmbA